MNNTYSYDNDLLLKDAGLIAVSKACQVGGLNKILDLGEAQADGDIVLDVNAVEIDSNNETFGIAAQVSSDPAFAADVTEVSRFVLGKNPGGVNLLAGKYVIPFDNKAAGVLKRYFRLYVWVGGTVATGIDFIAYLSKS